MLAFRNRLRSGADIQSTIRGGKRVVTPLAAAYVLSTSPSARARVAVVVGKKVSKSAVVRHRIQRQLRHGIYNKMKQYPTGYDMVVVAQSAAKNGISPQRMREMAELIYNQVQSIIG